MLRQKRRTSPAFVIALSLTCLALIAVGILLFLNGSTGVDSQTIQSIFQVEGLDPNAKNGALPDSPKDEKSPGEDLFSYRINTAPSFDGDGTSGNILVENPHFNEYLMVLEIADADNLLYTSQYIAPNQYIEKIDLQTTLDVGAHSVTAYLNAIDPATMKLVGTLECPITLTVK